MEDGKPPVQLPGVPHAVLVTPVQLVVVCPKDGKTFNRIQARQIMTGRILIFIRVCVNEHPYNSPMNVHIANRNLFGQNTIGTP